MPCPPIDEVQPLEEEQAVEKLMSITVRRSSKLPAIRQLAAVMLEKYNGVEGLATIIFDHIDKALKKSPGSKQALDALKFVVKLIEAGLEEEKVQLDLTTMPQEELHGAVMRYLKRQVPELMGGNGAS